MNRVFYFDQEAATDRRVVYVLAQRHEPIHDLRQHVTTGRYCDVERARFYVKKNKQRCDEPD